MRSNSNRLRTTIRQYIIVTNRTGLETFNGISAPFFHPPPAPTSYTLRGERYVILRTTLNEFRTTVRRTTYGYYCTRQTRNFSKRLTRATDVQLDRNGRFADRRFVRRERLGYGLRD